MGNATTSPGIEPKAAYGLLFCSLLVYFVAIPLFEVDGAVNTGLDLLVILALLNALRTATRDPRLLVSAVLLGILAMSEMPMLALGFPLGLTLGLTSGAFVVVMVLIGGALLLDVYGATVVSHQTILGACSVYLLIGFAWFGVFTLLEIAKPDSFAFAAIHPSDQWQGEDVGPLAIEALAKQDQLMYFTFVTITTLGFGDVQPVSTIARTYTTLAAVLGQLFLAVMIARLVGIHSSQVRAPVGVEPGRD